MVRRLIQQILLWIRRVFLQGGEPQSRPRSTSKPQNFLPQQPPNPRPNIPSTPIKNRLTQQAAPPPRPSTDAPILKQETTANPAPSPRKQVNPASPRATSRSNFQVLLSNYQRPPSSAIQDLHQQLAKPDGEQQPAATVVPPVAQQSPQPRANKPESFVIQPKPAETNTASPSVQPFKVEEQLPTPASIPTPKEPLIHSDPAAPEITQLRQQNARSSHQSLVQLPEPETRVPEATPSPSPSPLPKPEQAPTASLNSGRITKQGTIKLLFKLKRNNYHGYIAPNDGSKDIIFHQKYIGSDIFAQLERGMEVEVTAHVTEGKAYADHIHIL